MEIEEGNKLIAEFLGSKFINDAPENYPNGYYYQPEGIEDDCPTGEPDKWCFNSSWDWLMPVLIKIERLGYGWRLEVNVSVGRVPLYHCTIGSFYTMAGISALDASYGAVTEFIKWYNGNNLQGLRN